MNWNGQSSSQNWASEDISALLGHYRCEFVTIVFGNCFLALFNVYMSLWHYSFRSIWSISFCPQWKKNHNYCKTTKSGVCMCFGNSVFICMAENTSSATEWCSSLIPVFGHKQRKLELLSMDQSWHIVSEDITSIIGSVL